MKKGATWIDRTLIESPFCIGLCQTEKQFYKELKRLNIPKEECPNWISEDERKDGCVWHFKESNGIGRCCIVCIKKNKNSTPDGIVGLLIHESVHIWQRFKHDINETNPSPEFEAYTIQRIAQNLISAYKMK